MLIISIGGVIPIYLLSLLFGWIFFRKSEIRKKIIYSVIVSYLVSTILSGFGNMNGGSFNPFVIEYLMSSIIVIGIRLGFNSLKKNKNGDGE